MTKSREYKTPFFSRAYGGFTPAQETFFLQLLGNVRGKTIFDPMAGQAFALSSFAHCGAHLWLGDVIPAPLLLAFLRDPQVISKADYYFDRTSDLFNALSRRRARRGVANRFVPGWVAPEIASDLQYLANGLDFGLFSNPFFGTSDFWSIDDFGKFVTAIVVMAARDLSCYRETDNRTWLKPGGLLRENRAVGSLRRALGRWAKYASTERKAGSVGTINVQVMNAARGEFGPIPKVPYIITSPPYANRLDYTRLWGPELNTLAAMCEVPIARMKAEQIGTTVVEDLVVSEDEEGALPGVIQAALRQVRADPAKYSDVYYYPFFKNYAITLKRTLIQLAKKLKTRGTIVIFVRDTVRKDVLFRTGELVTSVLTSEDCRLQQVACERRVIRHHIGLMRKASSQGLYGAGQQEWWLAFNKPPGVR